MIIFFTMTVLKNNTIFNRLSSSYVKINKMKTPFDFNFDFYQAFNFKQHGFT